MITAKEAKEISTTLSTDDCMKFLEDKVVSAANKKETSIIIRSDPYARWMYDISYEKDVSQGREVIGKLRDLGYTVTEHYEEHQFVDMGLKISW